MKCLKNPRYKNRDKARVLARMMEINAEHIAYLLAALNRLYPKQFYKRACAEFIRDYMDTVREFDADNDGEIKDHKIRQYLADAPYITADTARTVYEQMKKRPMNKLDSLIYNEKHFADSLVENILLMLIQLHVSNGFGADRLRRVTAEWKPIPEPYKWLSENAGADLECDDMDVWNYLKDIDESLKDKEKRIATPREQLDARRELEALKAYQDGVKNGS